MRQKNERLETRGETRVERVWSDSEGRTTRGTRNGSLFWMCFCVTRFSLLLDGYNIL